VGEYFYGAARKAATRRKAAAPRPSDRRGVSAAGKIARLLVGQGHGYIRLTDGREIFFHRADTSDGVSFNEFAVGDAVVFELLEDPVSGARALRVRRQRSRR